MTDTSSPRFHFCDPRFSEHLMILKNDHSRAYSNIWKKYTNKLIKRYCRKITSINYTKDLLKEAKLSRCLCQLKAQRFKKLQQIMAHCLDHGGRSSHGASNKVNASFSFLYLIASIRLGKLLIWSEGMRYLVYFTITWSVIATLYDEE